MNGNIELLDSNTLIYLSKKELSLADVIKPETKYFVSIISYMEVFGFPFRNPEEEEFLLEIFSRFEIVDISMSIAEQVILLKKAKKMKLPDAILAATAIINGWRLITRDVEDFRGIAGLNTINPFEGKS